MQAMTKEELEILLKKHGIAQDQWGKGKAKTVEHLLEEVNRGEARLCKDEIGRFVRHIKGAHVDVLYRNEKTGQTYHLTEERQVFRDGRIRKRNLENSLSEKMRPGENPTDTARRGLAEELGMREGAALESRGFVEFERASSSYPGLLTKCTAYFFTAHLAKEQFDFSGYIERQPDKTTYFIWEKCE